MEENDGVSSVQCPRCKGDHGWFGVNTKVTSKGIVAKTSSSWIDCQECGAKGFVSKSNGFARYAEFIRVQIELAKIPPQNQPLCVYPPFTPAHEGCLTCEWDKKHRSTVARLSYRDKELWGSWPYTNDVRSLMHASLPDLEGGWVVLPSSYLMHGSRWDKVNRGFIEQIAAPFDTHMVHLRDIVKRHPIKANADMVTDREPNEWSRDPGSSSWDYPTWYTWYRRSDTPSPAYPASAKLDDAIFDRLECDGKLARQADYEARDAAMLALANAFLLWAKS